MRQREGLVTEIEVNRPAAVQCSGFHVKIQVIYSIFRGKNKKNLTLRQRRKPLYQPEPFSYSVPRVRSWVTFSRQFECSLRKQSCKWIEMTSKAVAYLVCFGKEFLLTYPQWKKPFLSLKKLLYIIVTDLQIISPRLLTLAQNLVTKNKHQDMELVIYGHLPNSDIHQLYLVCFRGSGFPI